MTRDIPIIFSAPMILALLAGRKTMTRRLAHEKPQVAIQIGDGPIEPIMVASRWTRVKTGDRLWVKEALQHFGREPRATVQYVADITGVPHHGRVEGGCDARAYWNWKVKHLAGRYCPRWASRLTLLVIATKIEKLQEISEADAEAEGVECDMSVRSFRDHFAKLWDTLHGPGAWDSSPEVCALTFSIQKVNIDTLPKVEAA